MEILLIALILMLVIGVSVALYGIHLVKEGGKEHQEALNVLMKPAPGVYDSHGVRIFSDPTPTTAPEPVEEAMFSPVEAEMERMLESHADDRS